MRQLNIKMAMQKKILLVTPLKNWISKSINNNNENIIISIYANSVWI